MKKDVKTLIKRLTLLVQFTKIGKGWIAVDGDGTTRVYENRPVFHPSGESESLDYWVRHQSGVTWISDLDCLPLSMVCPSLTSREALFYTDGETVWLVETR
ncbi:pyruvate dehydrogenase (acetyl-transferring) E1 component subunit alpha [Aeromonas phage AhSzw-1]|uniref:Pyruvate dehydrogenase (Acetyl-transferring) E1 component subunit alpha n=1 Tax=Aeromonas phage AhSzw-1 TaxID=2138299 RepID=A0A2R4AMC5_9CAUD|nr:pyruvate dehydrogenase (acetyl-transferring) E1 component subunit alpha [Aeromonas phage AhSzw-1]AVR76174.1 pyruvate dehydrogenase (acetyl-transferring) E1 component subunit alpha [Aeromonas phage AhSzw-1]